MRSDVVRGAFPEHDRPGLLDLLLIARGVLLFNRVDPVENLEPGRGCALSGLGE